MNKTAIKNFAVTARVKLIESIQQKAYELGITKKEIKEVEVYQDGFRINDKFFKKYQMKQREKLLEKIKDQGYDQVIEEVAYTWFNRFIAIRFMEVNEYLPTGVRVLSSIDNGKVEPDAVSDVMTIADDLELNVDVVYRLHDENNTEELFKYILVKQCNKLGEILPMMFEQIEDYTELLLPDKLLSEGSVVRDLVTMVEEEDWKEQVEVIGWLYQFYITEKKDQIFVNLKKNKKITKEDIPAATQLFTPKWIVKYMVENSLGRLWLESHPNRELVQQWNYYLEEAEQDPEALEYLEKIKNKKLNPEEIKVLDPCMGSGHILVYAFDVLYQIYKQAGYAERDIPKSIIEKNLYGLDIDHRAAQLAYFAVMMKGRSYNRRFFKNRVETNLVAIQESNGISNDVIEYLINENSPETEGTNLRKEIEYLIEVFKDAKEYGSILDINEINFDRITYRLNQIKQDSNIDDLFSLEYRDIINDRFSILVKQAKIMSQNYEIVVTNPPYMGDRGMGPKLVNFVKEHYPNTKSDLFSCFIEKGGRFTKKNGYTSMITMESWMFLSSFEKLRESIITNKVIVNMVHMPYLGKGGTSLGINFGTTAFIFRNVPLPCFNGRYCYIRYYETDENGVPIAFPTINERYSITKSSNFAKIPGMPIAYWISDKMIEAFEIGEDITKYVDTFQGIITGDNEKFLRLWFEVEVNKIPFDKKKVSDIVLENQYWIPYNKGGAFRKWYGNQEYVVYWKNGPSDKTRGKKSFQDYYLREYVSWSYLTSSTLASRFFPAGFLWDVAGSGIFDKSNNLNYLQCLIGSKVGIEFLKIINPTFNYQVENIAQLPVIISEIHKPKIDLLVSQNIAISKLDWDSFEISWNFDKHPFLKYKHSLISSSFNDWNEVTENQIDQLTQNEEELNRLFIEIYGLQNELKPEEKKLTIRKADYIRDTKSFISYVVGCILGRYSLDQEGLVYAGGEFDQGKYITYTVDMDNIIPITDDEYFEDDIVNRFIDFVRVTFGQDTLESNLDFIADALTKKVNETSRQRIRRYFVKEFYKDHLQTYQKRPIYWLFDSGKNDGFKALIYIHRYDVGTVAKIRTDYLHTLQRKYEAEISRLDLVLESDVSTQEKTKAKKQKEKIQKQLLECQQYDQVIAHVANQKIKINLDDGIKVTYEKFQNIEVPQGEGKKALKANLLAQI